MRKFIKIISVCLILVTGISVFSACGKTNGDLGRIQAQQSLAKEFVVQCMTTENIRKIPQLYKTASRYMRTNLTGEEVVRNIGVIEGFARSDISTYEAPGTAQIIGGVTYYVLDSNQMKKMSQSVFKEGLSH